MEIKGSVQSIRFKNEENGFAIGNIETKEDVITFVGIIPNINVGMNLRLEGDLVIDPKWGRQFKVTFFEEIMPDSLEGIEKYLASGVIMGIGPATAKKIVKHFGISTLDILDEDVNRLGEVKGIGKKKLDLIKASYEESREVRNIMLFLHPLGISSNQCLKIHNKYGKDAVGIIKENPYSLCYDISSFGFKRADKLAENLGISKDSKERFHAGLMYILSQKSGQGNTMVPLDLLKKESMELLEIEEGIFDNYIRDIAIEDENIFVERLVNNYYVALKKVSEAEKNVAARVLSMIGEKAKNHAINEEELIEEYEKLNSIKLHDGQKEAVVEALNNNITIITGGPGTGKTTIIKCILYLLTRAGEKIALAAPTGRAAKRMKETTGKSASTIHRLLSLKVKEDIIEEDQEELEVENNMLNVDSVIVDEASMIDIILMNSLLKFLKEGTRLILVGDKDQLPSVGPGRVLGDLIDSEMVKTVKLLKIYRQGAESMIITNAHRINEGEEPIVNKKGGDFFFLQSEREEEGAKELEELIKDRLPNWNKDWDRVKDIQVLCPMRKKGLGVEEVNEVLRKALNPNYSDNEDSFTGFNIDDKVMQVKNNYNLKGRRSLEKNDFTKEDSEGVFNGDIGYVKAIDEDNKIVTVLYDDMRYVDYNSLDLDDLELAYGITIHKSQGSEFPVVIIPVYWGAPNLMTRNLIYTAVTRGRKLVIVIGSRRALSTMIKNVRSIDRYTSLMLRLKNAGELSSFLDEEIEIGSIGDEDFEDIMVNFPEEE